MGDFLTKEKRSNVMSRVRTRGTSAELQVRKAAWAEGYRYRLNDRRLPGSPDLVFPRHQTAVFVHGCFWHGHSCRKGQTRPKSNIDFWNQKLDGNLDRDVANQDALRELGWKVFVIWECILDEGTVALIAHLDNRRAAFH